MSRSDHIKLFIQARMSSSRFPGKVLAPFRGRTMIVHTIEAAQKVLGPEHVVLLTSDEPSDDPLALYMKDMGVPCFRGPLDDVYSRFCRAAEAFEAHWVIRVSGDSPFMSGDLLAAMIEFTPSDCDLVTNVFPRTFPKGHSVEIIRAECLLDLPYQDLTAQDKENVTPYFYSHADRFEIISVTQDRDCSSENLCVDTLEDYRRLSERADSNILYDAAKLKVVRNINKTTREAGAC